MHTQLRRSIQHSQKYAAFLEERIRLKERKAYFKNMKLLIHQCESVQSAEVSLIKTEVKESHEIEASLKLEDESETDDNKETNHKKDIEDIEDIEVEVKKEIFTESDSDMSTTDEITNFSSTNQALQMNLATVTNTPTVILLPPFVINSEGPTSQPKIGTYVSGTCGLGIRLPPGWPPPAKIKPKQPKKSISHSLTWKKKRQAAQVEVGQVAQEEVGQLVQAKRSKSNPKPRKEKISKPIPLDRIEIDHSGIFVPLNEYYYGTSEGDLTYQENKEEISFKFKCWYCCRWGFNNIEVMDHIYKHVDPGYQLGFNLLDLPKCKLCLMEFNTPFELQIHIEKWHAYNFETLLCRICEKENVNINSYSRHMSSHHNLCEMPYICQLCKFRSSMHSDVVDHFKKKHINSEFLLCFFCLHVFKSGKSISKDATAERKTIFYYQHVAQHLDRRKSKKCRFCKLSFTSKLYYETHRKNDHLPCTRRINELKAKYSSTPVVEEYENVGGTDCPLVPAMTKCMDHNLILPPSVSKHKCIECKMLMGIPKHYGKLSRCSLCRFATRCSFAYFRHFLGPHSHKHTKTISDVSSQGRMKEQFYCACGFVSCHGNLFANHMIVCSEKSSCKYVGPASGPGEFDFKKLAIKEEIVEADELEDAHTGGDDNEVKCSYTMTLRDILSEDHIKQEVKQERMSEFP